jgi:hypothetical protein
VKAGFKKSSQQGEQWMKYRAANLVFECSYCSELNLVIKVSCDSIRWMNGCEARSRIVVAEDVTETAVDHRARWLMG